MTPDRPSAHAVGRGCPPRGRLQKTRNTNVNNEMIERSGTALDVVAGGRQGRGADDLVPQPPQAPQTPEVEVQAPQIT